MLDPVFLSRVQFGFVISFHILFPAFTIGLASWLAFVEAAWLRTGKTVWRDLYFFWLKIFALSFGMGVVSGIVMSFQFGTNWARLSEVAGNILGPLMTNEVLTAFFLEAAFLGVMLFGWTRVSARTHFGATAMVALGTLLSTFWIIAANSFMHTPAGFEMRDGVLHAASWWDIVFNPSFPYRLAHMVLAAFLTTGFVVGAIASRYLLRGQHTEAAGKMLRMAVLFTAITAPLQILAGDAHGLNVHEHQPVKLAAMEGDWETLKGQPLVLFGIPDPETESNRWEIAIPKLGSLIIAHDLDGEIKGLKDFPKEDRPPVLPVFVAFRVMVGIGVLMVAIALTGVFLLWRGRLLSSPWYWRAFQLMFPMGFVAVLAGWFTAEIGRQPWVIYGVLRTADASSRLPMGSVLASLIAFALVYFTVFGAGVGFLWKIVKDGPKPYEPHRRHGDQTAARPLSAIETDGAPDAPEQPPLQQGHAAEDKT